MRRIFRRKSMTLIEIVAVVAIIAIIMTGLTPQYMKMMEKYKRREAEEILVRMYQGYQECIMDSVLIPEGSSYKLYNYTKFFPPGENYRCFNPDESNLAAGGVQPADRSAPSWAALGFKQNPNYENDAFYFSYDFLKPIGWNIRDCYSWGPFPRGNGCRPPDHDAKNLGVAWRKTDGYDKFNELYNIDINRWIAIDMDTGVIYRSDTYK